MVTFLVSLLLVMSCSSPATHDRPRPARTRPKPDRSPSIAYVTNTGVIVAGENGRPISVDTLAARRSTAEPVDDA